MKQNYNNHHGVNFEYDVKRELDKHFGNPFVHHQNKQGSHLFDFIVYAYENIIGIDCITAPSNKKQNLTKSIRLHIKRYRSYSFDVFLVNGTESFKDTLDTIKNVPSHISLVNFQEIEEKLCNKYASLMKIPEIKRLVDDGVIREFELHNLANKFSRD